MDKLAPPEEILSTPLELSIDVNPPANLMAMAHKYVADCDAFVVDSAVMYEVAMTELGNIRTAEKRIEEERDARVRPRNTAVRQVNALFKMPAELLAKAKAKLSPKVLAFETQERIRREAEEKLALETRRAEQAEAQRKLEIAQEEAKQPGADMGKLLDAEIEAATADLSITIPSAADPLDRQGHAKKVTWKGEVVDLPAFLHYVADSIKDGNETFNNTVEIKIGQINKFADATKGMSAIPGLKFSKHESIIARANY